MTLASSISLTACALEAGVGLLALALSGAPGWRHLRLLAFIAFTAAAYSGSSIPQTLTDSESIIVGASRISLWAIALHLVGWIAYSAPTSEGRTRLGSLDRLLLAGLFLASALALWPGVLAAPRVLVHELPWLGLRYATAEPTALAEAIFLFFFAAMAVPAWRFARQVRERTPGALAQALGFAVLLATGINEGLVAARLVQAPYLLDLGFLAVVLPITGEVSRRLVGGARSLADLSSRLEGDVVARTRALAEARQALQESERSYAEIFDATREAVAVHDLQSGRMVEANLALAELVGCTRAELLSPEFRPFDGEPPYSEAEAAERMQRAVQEGPQHFEWLARRKNGAQIWLEVQLVATAIRGQPRLLASMRDVTARKVAEEALRRSEERHRRLLEGMTDAYAAVSLDGRVEEANEAFTGLLGHSIEELRGLTFEALTPERWRAGERRILEEQVLVRGSSEVYEKEYLRRDGTILPVELRTFLIRGEGGQPTGMWAIVRDIGERKRAEQERERLQQQLLQAQKLESIGRLAGGVAHDFNNLLTVIMSCSSVLEQDLAAGAAPNPEDVAEIRAAGERARDVTRQLLAFARKQVIAPVVLDPNAIVRGSEKLLKRVLGEDIQQRVELQPDLWAVSCDPVQLEQVILNLALNARDAMPRGGTLTIETHNLPSGATPPAAGISPPPGDLVHLVVRDSGAGMSPETQTHLFEPFFTTKPSGLGTGLGLATVHGMVTQSGGQVQVQSEPGRGTAFHIFLPRATQPVAPEAAEPASRALGGSETILLVEDERPVREVTARALRGAGYRVLLAQDGAEALELAARETGRLDLLVTDVVMPGLDGRALAEELRRRRGPLGVLYLSGYTQEVISHRGILDSGLQFLAKPYTPEVLLARVRRALDAPSSPC
jgi:PAS domain S-box-containing protein